MSLLRKSPTESDVSHVAPDPQWVWDIYRTVIMIFENTVTSKASISLQISSRRLHFADISSCQPFALIAGMRGIVEIHKAAVLSIIACKPFRRKVTFSCGWKCLQVRTCQLTWPSREVFCPSGEFHFGCMCP